MPLSPNTSVVLPKNEVAIGIFPGGTSDYTGNWPQARTDLESWWNTGGATGHRFKMLHAIVGGDWTSGSYYNSRTMWQGIPSDVQPLISIPSMFPSGGTYDLALGTTYDAQFQTVYNQIAADYPYSSIRIGQEVDGNWFWWGIGQSGTNGATALKIAQLHTKHHAGLVAAGWKGTYEVNAGNFNGFNISSILDNMSPSSWDIATCDSYFLGNTVSQALDPVASWTNAIYPMIANAMAMASKYGKQWGMSEWSQVKYVDGSPQTGMVDSAYGFQQLRSVATSASNPRCAYLSIFYGNDHNGDGSIHRRDAMANPASLTSGPWSNDSNFPLGIAEFKSSNWTPSGLTVQQAGTAAAILPRPKGRRRHTSMIFG